MLFMPLADSESLRWIAEERLHCLPEHLRKVLRDTRLQTDKGNIRGRVQATIGRLKTRSAQAKKSFTQCVRELSRLKQRDALGMAIRRREPGRAQDGEHV
jgi:hypothetical protein